MSVRVVAAAGLLLFGLFGVPEIPNVASPAAGYISVEEPNSDMKSVVKPVCRVVQSMSITDRVWLNNIYANAARVLEADGLVDPTITSTAGLRALHVAILKFIWKGMANNQPGEYAGLSEAVDLAMTKILGVEQRALTEEDRRKAVDVFEAIAWAGLGKG